MRRSRPAGRKGSTPEQYRRWFEANRDHRLAYMADWRKRNKVRIAVLSAAKRAREMDAPGVLTVDALQARIDFYGGMCWICRKPWEGIDHVIPWVRGGSNWPSNVRPICRSCNSRKSSRDHRVVVEAVA